MNSNFKRLLAALLALCMIVTTFTFTVAAAEYPDISTVTSATISEIKVNEPLGYKVGQDIVFKFQIKGDSSVVIAPYLYYSAVMDDGRTLTGYVEPVDGAYTVTLEGGLLRPGFVLMTVNACDANKSTLSVPAAYKCGAGAGIDDIQSIYGMPDEYSIHGDFDAFWDKTLEQLDADGGEATIQYIYYCGTVTTGGVTYDAYELEINCPIDEYYDKNDNGWCGTNHVQAYLTIPQGATAGSLGFLLDYKGHDWVSASGSKTNMAPQSSICNAGKITLSVSPHSIPAPHNVPEGEDASNLSDDGTAYLPSYYSSTLKSRYGYTKNHGANESENASPYTTYFKYMILRDVQAVNFLKMYFGSTGVPSTVNGVNTSAWAGLWDGTNIKTSGSSQGGFQAIAVAGLVPEVNEVYAGVPWFADQGVTSADSDRYQPADPRKFPYGEGLRYMDTANLAARINPDCNVTINAGLIDTLVPPSTVMSIYDLMDCKVSLTFHQNKAHSTGGTEIYKQTISKTADTTEKNHTINYVSEFDSDFKSAFEDAWAKVCDEKVVTVDIYKVDKDTDTDFTSLATSSTADAIGIVLTGDGLTNINKKLAEIYALHNDVNSKVWVIENDGTLNGENAAITLDACMNWGDRPTGDASFALYGADGVKGQSFVLTANEPHALIPSPLWISGQGILTTAENITFEGGLLSSTGEDGSISFSAPAVSATFESVGVGDAEDYGNIESVGLWIYKDEKLTIKGAGAMPDYASTAETPWKGKAITEIEITEGVTSIGAYAFAEFDATVNIPKSVTAIATTAINTGSTIVSYDNAYAKTFAANNGFAFTNLGGFGTIGADLYWHLDTETGLFTVTGTGTDLYAQDNDGNEFTPASNPWTGSNWSTVQYYEYRNAITKIVIEAPIKSIQDYCFTFLDKCTTVELPEAYTGTNTITFNGMTSLTCIYTKGQTPEVGTANLSNLTIVGDHSMVQVPVTKVILNDKVTSIGTKVFHSCTKLAKINLPASLKSIGNQAFYNCTALTELTLPVSVTTVKADAFSGCTNIATLTVKNSSLEIEDFAAYLTGLKLIVAPEGSPAQTYATENKITFEAYEEVIASGECGTDLYWKLVDENGTGVLKIYGTGTETYSGSGGYKQESKSVFYPYQSQIKKIEFCDSVTTIGGKTFYALSGIEEVELTENITTIEESAFANCANLKTIYVKGNEPVEGTYDLSYVTSMTGGYQFDGAGKSTTLNSIILSDNLTGEIGHKFVAYSKTLTEITFPEGVTSLADRAVYNCTALKTMTVLGADTTIGENFLKTDNNTTVLTTIRGIKGSPAQTYADANSITFVALKEAVATGKAGENLEWKIVEETDGTHTMTIYGTGTDIKPYDATNNLYGFEGTGLYGYEPNAHVVFDWYSYASDVDKIVIEASVTSVLGYTFASFNNVTVLELPVSLTTTQNSSFNDMNSLKTIYTKGQTPVEGTANLTNLTSIGTYSFVLNAFSAVELAENVTINANAFVWCTNLQSVEIPEGATVASSAFRGYANNNSLVSVTYPASFDTVVYSPFTVYGADDASNANNYITTITVKNPDAAFEGITDGDYSVFLTKLSALTTVYGYTGSTAETFVACANEYFDTNSIDRTLTFIALEESDENVVVKDMPIGDNLWYRLLLNEDGETYTMDIYGEGANCYGADSDGNKVTVSYNITGTDRSYYEDRAKIVKLKISAPNITSFADYMFQDIAIETIEVNANITEITTSSAFNGMRNLKTFYTTGQIPEEGTANLTNFTKLGKYTFVSNLFEKIILGDSIAEIPLYCFGNNQNTSVLKSVEIPASVTNIADYAFAQAKNLVYIKFNNDNFTYQANSFAGMAARATIIAPEGSKGESLATELGVQFIDSAEAPEIVAYYTNDNSVLLLAKIDDSNYTAFCTGSATYFNMGYTDYYKAVESKDGSNGPNRVWDDYKSLITKAVYVNPNFTKIDSSFAKHASLKTVELPASVTTITESCFNQSGLTTLYVTGNEMVESVVDLRNVTSIGGMAMAGCQAKNILLSDDLTGTWGNNMFWNCSNLTYIRIPKGVTKLDQVPFNSNVKSLTTVLIENPELVFPDLASYDPFKGASKLSTIIGYKGSEAETYANAKGLTFIPIDAAGVLNFDGFQVKKSGTNGLRSLYTANLTKMETYEDAGFRVVEFGSILASTAKLTAAGESNLTIYKNENGEYKSSSFAFVYPIYQNGSRTNNKIIKDTPAGVNAETGEKIDHTVEYACTVTEFNETNYNMEVISRGYVVYADAEGNEYIVYADLYDDDGNNADPDTGKLYNSTTLEIVCTELLEAGLIDNTYISWIDVQNFKNVTTVTAS